MFSSPRQAPLLELLLKISAPLVIVGDDFRVLAANQMAGHFFGLEPDDIQGCRFDAIFAFGQAPRVVRCLKWCLLSGASAFCDEPFQTCTGRNCLCIIAPIVDCRGTTRIIVNLADVTGARTLRPAASHAATRTIHTCQTRQQRHGMAHRLREAVTHGQLELYYQPQIDLLTGQTTCVEALLRWVDPAHGLIPAGRFVPLAEDCGLIRSLDRWALATACRQVRDWFPSDRSPIRVAVNLSPLNFSNASIVDTIRSVLDTSRLAPKHLSLEITEGRLLRITGALQHTLHDLSDLGVELVLDDFGTGYTSLRQLRELPFNKIKIDRSITAGLATSARDRAITQAIITLGRTLGLRVIAEGVETKTQLAHLRKLECDEVQGYLLSKPMPANACEHHLAAGLDYARRDHGSCV